MSQKKLIRVLAIAAVDVMMFAGVAGVLLDVAAYAPSNPPNPMFRESSAVGVLAFGVGLIGRIVLLLENDR
jgi:hypothetical protein